MRVYRLAKEKYRNDLSGVGSEKHGGRWNNRGTRLVYTAESRSLAILELAVHVAFNILPKNYYLIEIEVPAHSILEFDTSVLKDSDWKSNPPIQSTQNQGDGFVGKGTHLCLRVPSAIVPGEYNILINPGHIDFSAVHIKETMLFEFDERLFKEFEKK